MLDISVYRNACSDSFSFYYHNHSSINIAYIRRRSHPETVRQATHGFVLYIVSSTKLSHAPLIVTGSKWAATKSGLSDVDHI